MNDFQTLLDAFYTSGLYLNEIDSREFTIERNPASKYYFRVSTREVFGNYHRTIIVKDLSTNKFLTHKEWVLQEIFFQDDWHNMCTPVLKVVDPNGKEFRVFVPKVLKPYIVDIPLSSCSCEDCINRILEAIEMFLDVTKYANKEEYENAQL